MLLTFDLASFGLLQPPTDADTGSLQWPRRRRRPHLPRRWHSRCRRLPRRPHPRSGLQTARGQGLDRKSQALISLFPIFISTIVARAMLYTYSISMLLLIVRPLASDFDWEGILKGIRQHRLSGSRRKCVTDSFRLKRSVRNFENSDVEVFHFVTARFEDGSA